MATSEDSYDEFRQRSYFSTLDGIRAIAVLFVVAVHVDDSDVLQWWQGARGVTWFFALSGFLITTLAQREEESNGSLAVRPFFVRRAFRIVPLYVIALIFTLLADMLVFRNPATIDAWASYWPYYLTMMQDIPLNLGWPNAPFGVAWSLAVEEKFYIAWPIIGFVVFTVARRLQGTVAMVSVLTFGLLMWPDGAMAKLSHPYLPILLGCTAALLVHNRRYYRHLIRFVGPALLVVCAAVVLTPYPVAVRSSQLYSVVYPLAVATAVAVFALVPKVPLLCSAPLLWVGRRSYGVYLFHGPIIKFLGKLGDRTPIHREVAGGLVFVVGVAISLVVADMLYRKVEHPLILAGRRRANRHRPAVNASS